MRMRVRVCGKVRDLTRVAVRIGLRGRGSLPCVERSFSSAAAAVPRCASASSACARVRDRDRVRVRIRGKG